MSSDRELLELAAKAAGAGPVLCYESARNCLRIGDRKSYALWRPLTDDGDALRLAVRLQMDVFVRSAFSEAVAPMSKPQPVPHGFSGREAATRRAIVRAAADVGRAMP